MIAHVPREYPGWAAQVRLNGSFCEMQLDSSWREVVITYISVICGNQAEARKRQKGKMAFMEQGAPVPSLGQLQRLCGCLPLRGDELPWTNVRWLQATPGPHA